MSFFQQQLTSSDIEQDHWEREQSFSYLSHTARFPECLHSVRTDRIRKNVFSDYMSSICTDLSWLCNHSDVAQCGSTCNKMSVCAIHPRKIKMLKMDKKVHYGGIIIVDQDKFVTSLQPHKVLTAISNALESPDSVYTELPQSHTGCIRSSRISNNFIYAYNTLLYLIWFVDVTSIQHSNSIPLLSDSPIAIRA